MPDIRLVLFTALALSAAHGQRPPIVKLGTIDVDLVETTPVVFKGRLYRFEYVRHNYWANKTGDDYFRFVDHQTGQHTPAFAKGRVLGSAFVDGGTMYVTGTGGRGKKWGAEQVWMFASRDLKNWQEWVALDLPGFSIFNTSMCKAGNRYVLMFEIDKPKDQAGVPFTARFATSRDLKRWELTPAEANYAKDRYTAPHCLRYLDGYFYNFYLEAHDGYEMRVVRSKDLVRWEPSPLNPVLRASEEDRKIANPKLNEEQKQRIATAVNRNNSDIDFCEYKGRLIINYSWGNQQGVEHLAEALYEGTESAFLKAWFPASPHGAAATYYVDSAGGRNTNKGTSAESAWQDFTNVNGRTLGPGDRLLIKRGSVINQELRIAAQGTPDRWAEVGAYAQGPRPVIRRNWYIGDRCALIKDPDYLRISGLAVSYAGKGLVVHYETPGHQGLAIEDCIAYHIEGLYRPNCSGIPEWRDYSLPQDDGLSVSAGIAVTGKGRDITIRNCDLFHSSWGFFVGGERVTLDRMYTHACHKLNTSPHPALVSAKDSTMQNCIFDNAGWHAYAGTMGIMLVNPQGLTIRNCTFRNQPDSQAHDEGGIDFEGRGDGCLIDNCTFENNAGAAIEVLGLTQPQARNIEIRNSRFIRNNWAKKLGPGEIFIWAGKTVDPKISCSTGSIRNNSYVLLPGVEFLVNKAPATTSWTLQDNREYPSVEALNKGVAYNRPPSVEAGPDVTDSRMQVRLAGSVRDDGKPARGKLKITWEVLEGAGEVVFKNGSDPKTVARFSRPGDYLLRMAADDGELWTSDTATVHILKPGVSVGKSWEFNSALDKEGWTEVNPGTRERQERAVKQWPCDSRPVKYVAGGYYIIAIEDSPDAHLLSPDALSLDVARYKTIRVRFQNHTPATSMRFRFTTNADPAWDEAKGRSFEVTANDNGVREYAVDMSKVPGWSGALKQLRLDLSTGSDLSGTCRIDYIRIEN